jgi:hypothetical protein
VCPYLSIDLLATPISDVTPLHLNRESDLLKCGGNPSGTPHRDRESTEVDPLSAVRLLVGALRLEGRRGRIACTTVPEPGLEGAPRVRPCAHFSFSTACNLLKGKGMLVALTGIEPAGWGFSSVEPK